MGVVAPGNKQIGSYTFNLLQGSKAGVKISTATGFALTLTDAVPLPTVPYNVNLGSCTFTTLTNSKNVLKVSSVLGLALVKYSPPTRLYFNSVLGLAAVRDSATSYVLAQPKNVALGTFLLSGLQRSKSATLIRSVVGLALVQYFDQRKESTYHSINYGLNKAVKV